eukprot:TRINITY_DN850_c0_g1_i1.p1 TRINITY_DN850_c0_g1~~TRINITY_DN850_c0_g1_i1.p1  ORF type:complete len:372 (+),score=176.92 TRINITY_DN850_c0_g1_i1:78-1118(+)
MCDNKESLEGVIYGMGNPLLDISAVVDEAFLAKYGLSLNNAVLAGPEHMPIYQDLIEKYNVEYIAGGATQNSIRVAQWMLQTPGATSYVGCVGKDKYAEELRNCATSDGVAVHYLEDENVGTGTCAVLVVNQERSLVANLGAANHYKKEHLLSDAIAPLWQKAKIFYIAGFFLTVSPPAALEVAEHSLAAGKTFCLNLSAPFICQFFLEPVKQLLPLTDILFGNESECKAIGEALGLEDLSLSAIALHLANYERRNASRPRTVVITQGSQSTLIAYNGQIAHFAVPAIPSERIVDVNGAGDAFVGGFLSGLAKGAHLFDCVRAGHYAAGYIIQTSGTKLSGTPNFQ